MVSYTSPPPSHFHLFFSPLVLTTQSTSTSFVNPLFVYVPCLENREQNRVYLILPVYSGGCVPYPPLPPSLCIVVGVSPTHPSHPPCV